MIAEIVSNNLKSGAENPEEIEKDWKTPQTKNFEYLSSSQLSVMKGAEPAKIESLRDKILLKVQEINDMLIRERKAQSQLVHFPMVQKPDGYLNMVDS
jgi:hypothetical protein